MGLASKQESLQDFFSSDKNILIIVSVVIVVLLIAFYVTYRSGKKAGGEEAGYKPTELLLFGIAGCTGIDVVRVMEKMRQNLKSLEIELVAHQQEEYPKPFPTIEIKFKATGENLNPEKLKQAIKLSEEKYCVVSQTVTEVGKIITSFEIV